MPARQVNAPFQKRRPPLHALERALLFVACLTLCLPPWTYGLNKVWTGIGCAGLAALTLAIALVRRRYTEQQGEVVMGTYYPARRLLHFPLFWLGGCLIALMVIGACNPAWFYETNGYHWQITAHPNVSWLPTSVDTPFSFYSAWRTIVVYLAAWMIVCALWIGITRRRSLQIMGWVMAANGLALGVVGLIHRFSGPQYESVVLWSHSVRGALSYGSFVSRNHAGAYLCLSAALLAALAAWSYFEGRRKMARSSPTGMWLFLLCALLLAIAFSYSRASVIVCACFLVMAALAWVVMRWVHGSSLMPKQVTIVLCALFLAGGAFAVHTLDFSTLQRRFQEFVTHGEQEVSYQMRVQARERAVRMWEDHWVRGAGAGSFRFLFPDYIRDNKFISGGGRFFWEHAHIDWVEIPIEQGVTGVFLIAAAYFWWLWHWFKAGGWKHPFALMIFLGSVQTLLHATMDFPFQHPAVLVTWWALLIMALRWAEFEAPKNA